MKAKTMHSAAALELDFLIHEIQANSDLITKAVETLGMDLASVVSHFAARKLSERSAEIHQMELFNDADHDPAHA